MGPRTSGRAGSATPAVAALVRAGVPYRLHRIGHDPAVTAYGQEAALALGVAPERVLKTLVCGAGAELVVAVVPVAGALDLRALAGVLGVKRVDLVAPAVAERATGYVVGGISPLGQRRALATVVDEGAAPWETVFVSGGRRGLEIELAPTDLVLATHGRFAAIATAR